MADPAPLKPSLFRRLWRWVRWPLLAGILGLLVLGVFHRPLVLWVLNAYGPSFAKSAGVDLRWKVEGSLWSDLTVNELTAKLDGYDVKLSNLALHYDLAPAWQKNWFKIAKGVTLHDVTAMIDVGKKTDKPKPESAKPTDRKALAELLKTLELPDIDLQHINVTVFLADATLVITDLSLILPSGKEGTLHIGSIEHPQLNIYPLQNVDARLKYDHGVLEINALKLPPRIEVESLHADATGYEHGDVALATVMHSGKATVSVKASANIAGERPLIDANIEATGVDEDEIAAWAPGLPGLAVKVNKLAITAKGDAMQPRTLDATVLLDATQLAFQQWRGDSIGIQATLKQGKLEVPKIKASAGGNSVEVTTSADAPAEWAGFAHTPLTLQWKLTAPTLQTIAGLPVKLSGSINGGGDVKVNDQGLESFAANLSAQAIEAADHKVKSLDLKAAGNLKAISFDATALADAGEGKLDAHGSIGLEAGSKSSATWKVLVPKPDALAKSLGITWPADVTTEEVAADGEAAFDLAQLKDSKFDEAKGKGSLSVKAINWKNAPCPLVTAAWSIEGGKVTLSALDVQLAGGNHVHAEGMLGLAAPMPFDAAATIALPEVTALQPWVDATAPPNKLMAGTMTLDWKGSGSIKDGVKVKGAATVKIDGFRMASLPEAASLNTSFTHDLEGASFQELTASFGPWSTAIHGAASKTAIDLTSIEAFHSGKKLIGGCIQVPLDLNAKPVPIDSAKPLHVRIDTEGNLTLKELAGIAKAPLPADLSGLLSAHVELDGTLAVPKARIEVNADEVRMPNKVSNEPGNASVLVTLADGVLKGEVHALAKPLEPLSASLHAKIDPQALMKDPASALDNAFEASVHLDQPSLAFVKPLVPMLNKLEGSVKIDAHAEGTAKQPHLHGEIIINVPHVETNDTDLPIVKDLNARITGKDTTVTLESFHANVAGGEVNISGTCDLKDMKKPAFNVSLKAADLLVIRNDMMTQRTDADLHCQGTPTAAALSGSIGLTRGRVLGEVNFLPISKMMNDLPPLPDAKASKPSADPKASPLPPMLKDWTFNIDVRTKDSVRLLGNVLNGGVKIDLKVGGNGAAPQLTGLVNLERARLSLPFSTLHVKKGEVSFPADRFMSPNLELQAESTVDAYDVVLRGYGSALDPKLRFTSSPPLAEGEIATLLATGSTTSGLKKSGGDTAGRAVLFLVREAYRRMFVSKAKPKKDSDPEDESRFLVQERSEDGALGGVTGIYEFSRKMKIVGSTDKDGGFRAMLHYLFRFD